LRSNISPGDTIAVDYGNSKELLYTIASIDASSISTTTPLLYDLEV